jgi:hypothetical protein
MAPTGNNANSTVCDLREREVMPARLERGAMSARVETIASNKELYSTRDIAGAERVRNELRQLDFPSIQTYMKMIQRNSIVGSRVTPDDVRRMVRIYSPNIASLKGKTKRVTPPVVSTDRSLHFVVPTGITIHLDIMFVQESPFLITVTLIHLVRAAQGKIIRRREGHALRIRWKTQSLWLRRQDNPLRRRGCRGEDEGRPRPGED